MEAQPLQPYHVMISRLNHLKAIARKAKESKDIDSRLGYMQEICDDLLNDDVRYE